MRREIALYCELNAPLMSRRASANPRFNRKKENERASMGRCPRAVRVLHSLELTAQLTHRPRRTRASTHHSRGGRTSLWRQTKFAEGLKMWWVDLCRGAPAHARARATGRGRGAPAAEPPGWGGGRWEGGIGGAFLPRVGWWAGPFFRDRSAQRTTRGMSLIRMMRRSRSSRGFVWVAQRRSEAESCGRTFRRWPT